MISPLTALLCSGFAQIPRYCRSVSAALFWLVSANLLAAAGDGSSSIPYPTGSHLQLVRAFYATADGLPGDNVQAVTLTRDGLVLVIASNAIAARRGERWIKETGLPEATALFSPEQGAEAFAGTTNGVWALTQGRWQVEPRSPTSVIAFAAEPAGYVWALTPRGVWRRSNTWHQIHSIEADDMAAPRSFLPTSPTEVLVAAETGLFGLMGKRKYWLDFEVRPGGLLSRRARFLARLDKHHFLVATDKGLNLSTGQTGWRAFTGADGLPILDLTSAVTAPDGTVWLGSDQGLIRWKDGQWTYLAGKRWLPDNRVTALATPPRSFAHPMEEGQGEGVWVGTAQGLAHLHHRKLTLAEKAAILQEKLESRDRRHGFVTELQLRAPGTLEGAVQELSDNDGLWTALYIASQSFRFAATKSPEAKAQAWRSMQALLRLESFTGLSGFPARAICHVDEPQFATRSLRSNSEWHESPVETNWFWKGETSSDELDGHYFGWYVFHELAANDEEKRQVRATCKRVTDHILDHGFYLVDKDGQPTTWGVWAPEKLNDDPKWWQERGLNSLEILSHLKVAAHLVGEPRYQHAYQELIQKHHYALNTLQAKHPGGVSHDDQLLFLAYYPLLQLERDPGVRTIYTASLKRTWDFERIEANPLWNFIYGASTGEPCDVEAAIESLREMPLDFILWKTHNSHRADLTYDPVLEQQGIKRLLKPLPWTERVIHKWDKSPFELDGGSDLTEGDPTIWLLPYWMGRHHRLIE